MCAATTQQQITPRIPPLPAPTQRRLARARKKKEAQNKSQMAASWNGRAPSPEWKPLQKRLISFRARFSSRYSASLSTYSNTFFLSTLLLSPPSHKGTCACMRERVCACAGACVGLHIVRGVFRQKPTCRARMGQWIISVNHRYPPVVHIQHAPTHARLRLRPRIHRRRSCPHPHASIQPHQHRPSQPHTQHTPLHTDQTPLR